MRAFFRARSKTEFDSKSNKRGRPPAALFSGSESETALEDVRVSKMGQKLDGAEKNDLDNWAAIAERNKLLFENETNSIPFTANEVYEGKNRWATILKRGPEHLELSLGLRSSFGNPGQIDVAKDAETIVPGLARNVRGKRFLAKGRRYR